MIFTMTACETPYSERDAAALAPPDGVIKRAARISTLIFTALINPYEGGLLGGALRADRK